MANICSNEIKISFLEDNFSNKKLKKILDEFKEKFSYEQFDAYWISDDNDIVEISMGSKWTMPDRDELQAFATKYNCEIVGVSWEFGCNYVDSFYIEPE